MQVSEGYRIAKALQRLGALGQESDRVLNVRTIINQLDAHERAELGGWLIASRTSSSCPATAQPASSGSSVQSSSKRRSGHG